MRVGTDRQQSVEEFVAEFFAVREKDSLIYEPREDSFLMLDALAELDLKGLRVLDMGTGSGILAAYCAKKGAEVTASDIDANAVRRLGVLTRRLGISLQTATSDLFSEVCGQFDIVLFNPPYLPSEQIEDRTTDGGRKGAEVIHRFLRELPKHLTRSGYGILLVSSLNDPQSLRVEYPMLSFEILRQRSLFFETLYAVRVTAKQDR